MVSAWRGPGHYGARPRDTQTSYDDPDGERDGSRSPIDHALRASDLEQQVTPTRLTTAQARFRQRGSASRQAPPARMAGATP
jgi:hypothetical protein